LKLKDEREGPSQDDAEDDSQVINNPADLKAVKALEVMLKAVQSIRKQRELSTQPDSHSQQAP